MSRDSPKATGSCAVMPGCPRPPVFAKRCCPAQLTGLRLCPQALGLVHIWRALGHTCWMDDSAKAWEGSLLRGV